MATTDHQRIHPLDLESATAPSAPLVPRHQTTSEKAPLHSPNHNPNPNPNPPFQRSIPLSHLPPPKRRRSCFCKCLCWSLLLLILLIVAIAATAGILYWIFDPKLPKYSVNRLTISAFTVNTDLHINAIFNVNVTAINPNKKIGIYYLDGIPVFYQGHRNTTVMSVPLNGDVKVDSQLVSELTAQQQAGNVPLVFKGNVPVKIKFGALKLWKVTAKVTCDVTVNSLIVGSSISIKTSSCKFRLKL
ncbi:hypothetical protein IHE45_14G034600 [Dioscorea alata]|uniref:Uncharacterized protein n=1 Tax=Dioscorea alata TaxID=55571 RepID=A0ACB7UR68_DIOAL|nr:hypothetical protein IHE45_14G034600 [Dioscorea alata]